MQSMFQSIQDEITRLGIAAQPTDYLNFFCLGNRAAGPQDGPESVAGKKDAGVLSQRNRRFMIYVHSKFMVVDDEVAIIGAPLLLPAAKAARPSLGRFYAYQYLFCSLSRTPHIGSPTPPLHRLSRTDRDVDVAAGSANVNMRSLAGTRDSEIAAAIWQPAHLLARLPTAQAQLPRGEVHAFRMSVWREHLANGTSQEDVAAMMDPSALTTVHQVQRLAEVRSLTVSALDAMTVGCKASPSVACWLLSMVCCTWGVAG
jgi:phosphatidylserine/phosphatidylglycerophosphate/cardiolipin synthase-like enzyme